VASQKLYNLEARITEAILRQADEKLREADVRILQTNEKQTAELRREAEKRQAAPRRQDIVITEARKLMVEEILKYHAEHNESRGLKKLIDSEIRRLAVLKNNPPDIRVKNVGITFDRAKERCENDGGFLAEPKLLKDVDDLERIVAASGSGEAYIIGGKKNPSGRLDSFFWSSGGNIPTSFKGWMKGEPEGSDLGLVECQVLAYCYNYGRKPGNSGLCDWPCYSMADGYICQMLN